MNFKTGSLYKVNKEIDFVINDSLFSFDNYMTVTEGSILTMLEIKETKDGPRYYFLFDNKIISRFLGTKCDWFEEI